VDYPLVFQPLFKERVWGGRRLAEHFQKPLPAAVRIGESWEITDRPEGVSVITNGPLAGHDLRWLMEHHGSALMGRSVRPGERFPWLIKLLDAADDLSLQVHPPAHKAAELGGEPKTELWFIADAAEGAKIYTGLRPGVTRDEFARRAGDGTVADCFHVHPVRAGDAMFLPSGRVHALGGGNLVFEVQQNSDTTYRVFDWNRVGLDGRPRELHLEPSLASIDFSDIAPRLLPETWNHAGPERIRRLVRHVLFDVDLVEVPAGAPALRSVKGSPQVLGVTRGRLSVTGGGQSVHVPAGGFVLLPAAAETVEVQPLEDAQFLRVAASGHGL